MTSKALKSGAFSFPPAPASQGALGPDPAREEAQEIGLRPRIAAACVGQGGVGGERLLGHRFAL